MESQLFCTIEEECSIEELLKILAKVENINMKNIFGETALHLVTRRWSDTGCTKFVEAVQLLLDAGADINSKNNYNQTVLHLAINDNCNQIDFIRFLLQRGIDVDSQDSGGCTALHFAVQKHNKEIVECLIDAGADVNSKSKKGTALHLALQSNFYFYDLHDYDELNALEEKKQNQNIEIVKCLINARADINREDPNGDTPLHLAVLAAKDDTNKFIVSKIGIQNKMEIVECLVDAGASLTRVNEDGDTPLHLAADIANAQIIKYLVNRGADVNARNKTGMTPLHSLTNAVNHALNDNELFLVMENALEILLFADADVNAVEKTCGDTPLHNLLNTNYHGDDDNDDDDDYNYNDYSDTIDSKTSKSFFKVLKIFIKSRADFNIKNRQGFTPMDKFLFKYHYFMNLNYAKVLVETFIKYGFMDVYSLFTPKLRGTTILHEACYSLNYNLIKFLVNFGANIEAIDKKRETPLFKLIERLIDDDNASNYKIILDYFLDLNPDVNVIAVHRSHILNLDEYWSSEYPEFLWKSLIEYIAKKQSTGYLLHNSIVQFISRKKKYQSYLDICKKELKNLQVLKFSWFNLHDMLMDGKKKLKCYAKNKDLVREFNKLPLAQKYPIFGPHIVKRFSKAVKKQEVMEKSAVILSLCLPCQFDPSHLVIRKILSYVDVKYLRYLCEPESEEFKKKMKMEEFKVSFDKYFCNFRM